MEESFYFRRDRILIKDLGDFIQLRQSFQNRIFVDFKAQNAVYSIGIFGSYAEPFGIIISLLSLLDVIIAIIMKLFTSFFIVLLFTFVGLAQRTAPASKTKLAEITERGQMLYAYDVAAWHSTDAVVELSPTEGSFVRYIAQKNGSVWTVAYGKLNEKRDKFLIAYEAVQGASLQEFKVKKLDTPKENVGFYLFAARAIDVALKDFGGATRPYNVAVLPAKENQLYVYLVPAQTKVGVFPLGSDVRYLFSADGQKIVEKRQLHKSIIEFSVPEGVKPQTGFHTAVLDDAPEETDVFHVLAREPKIPELVVTSKYVYQIKEDGTIMYLMSTEAFRKVGKQ